MLAMEKTYRPRDVQEEIHALWARHRAYHAVPDASRSPYVILIPPPNVTAALHMGHALNNTLQDVLIRWRRMAGDNAVWIPGTDHAGIATQTVVDKRLQSEGRPALKDYKKLEAQGEPGRTRFIEKVQAWKDQYEARITRQLQEMGCSCDYERQRFTMDPVCAAAVREAFFHLFRDGLIYRGKRLVNWDPVSQTALADDEVEMRDVDGHFWYLRYPLVDAAGVDTGESVTVATTRPETMLGDTAVAVNPHDEQRGGLIGRRVRVPIVNRIVPVVADDYVVRPDPEAEDPKQRYASGFLKVTPAHDPNDYEIGRRHGLERVNVMAPDGSISADHGWPASDREGCDPFLHDLIGLDRYEAREAIVDWFRAQGLLAEVRPYRHTVGHSYRSHVPVEPYLSDQWYVRVTDGRLAGAALRAMAPQERAGGQGPAAGGAGRNGGDSPPWEGQLRFHPPRYARTFETWHENIRDWCISRQLWWGHRIPVWSLKRFGFTPPDQVDALQRKLKQWEAQARIAVYIRPTDLQDPDPLADQFVCVRDEASAEIVGQLEQWGFEQDPDVLDTWFSSALWPISTLGWPEPQRFAEEIPEGGALLERWNPSSTLCTAREIITLWVSRMVMFNLYFRDCLPFRDVFVHAMIQDGAGQKMSKSLGNGVDPLDIIHSHGADAMRFTLAAMTTHTQDVRLPVEVVCPHTGEAFEPRSVRTPAGYLVAAPIQECPSDPSRKMVTSYGLASGQARPTDQVPLARNTSTKFDQGRNLANKLWNAGRFVLATLQEGAARADADAPPPDPARRSLEERWILSRFAEAAGRAERSLRSYRFSDYAQCLQELFWRDLCDWYLEAIKPVAAEASPEGASARATLGACFDGLLRLLHPAMPYVTEKLWQQLQQVRSDRSLPDLALPPASLCIHAAWPAAEPASLEALRDERAEQRFALLQELVVTIRNVRNEYGVGPRRTLPVRIRAERDVAADLEAARRLIQTLAAVRMDQAGPDVTADPRSATGLAGPIEVYVDGLVDPAAERGRLTKRLDELARSRRSLEGRLANPGYVQKAPPELVEQTRAQLAEVHREMEAIERKLNVLADR